MIRMLVTETLVPQGFRVEEATSGESGLKVFRRIRPDIVLDESEWVPAKDIAYRLDYVRKWPPEHWTLAFQGHIHMLNRNDFSVVEDAVASSSRRQRHVAG